MTPTKVIRTLESQGFKVRVTRRQHLQVRKGGTVVTTMGSTPSDRRALANAEAQLRRHGFVGRLT